jgi:Tfp pilus assembly protein FimV
MNLSRLSFHVLAVLLYCMTASTWASDAATDAPTAIVYTTKAGDNIERLMQNAMPNSPLSPAVLRKSLADLNPKTVTGKAGQKFKTGTAITLPDHGQLVRSQLEPFAAASHDTPARSGYSTGDASSRRNWIRYP